MVGLPLALSLIGSAWGQQVVVLDHLEAPVEDTWIEEMSLAVPELEVLIPPAAFGEAAIHAQLNVVRDLLDAESVGALTWINVDDDAAHLSVAFVAERRAVVRVVDVANDADAPARLALAAREILANAIDLPAPAPAAPVAVVPPTTEDDSQSRIQATLGLTMPTVADAGGPRPGFDVEATWPVGPLGLGVAVGLQANLHHWRGSPRAVVRMGPTFVAAGADVAQLEWVTWVQPRLEAGLTLSRPMAIEGRIRYAPLRDEIVDSSVIYNSGRVEIGVHFGFVRQINGR